ncbi:DUF4149 domain-containing protein [Noviherbaspirillum agri]
MARARLLIATLWVGSLWTIGYLVAPTLFSTLDDRALAGSIAGSMFRIEAWLSLFCAAVLLVTSRSASTEAATKSVNWLVLGMVACTLLGYFGLQPFMADLRASAEQGGVMNPALRTQFGVVHGISSAFYLIQSMLGAILIWKWR